MFEPAPLASIGSLALWGAKNPINGAGIASYALWVSDGTATGTFKLIESALGPMSLVGELPANVVVFRVAHSELWRTDGTVAGTWRLATFEQDATLGIGASVADRIYFAARTADEGAELWVTDGWTIGGGAPRLVMDFTDPALGSATIAWISELEDALYIAVGRSSTHAGIYKWTGGADAPQLSTLAGHGNWHAPMARLPASNRSPIWSQISCCLWAQQRVR
ncbi:hypothetical protein GCM10011487_60980 [Steroidobacter agaridevorans]|uniref:Hyalin repeat-containing protein n=1 Tax=Steroidobacter agaridevorans TaxID=2695856 RepID=A0A829YN16_9GAMM|nr:hypothetical protein GCM10011487_60980 [Steroidobacter agaridevorans]